MACNRCGKTANLVFGQGGMGWYESFRCPSCGNAYEADGRLPAPEEFRQAIVAEEGEWALEAVVPASPALLKALRAELSLSLSEAKDLKRRMPGELRRGTRYEMEKLLQVLQGSTELGALMVRRTGGP